ncbi:hypothetical protein CEP53_000752 [Fusarium sp. AF-6]|nr:hypothetical protein CEP53_000752 [Fusarium sp. AF-6]
MAKDMARRVTAKIKYFEEEDYGQEGYDGSQYEDQGYLQHALYWSEREVWGLREQLWQCEEALQEARRSAERIVEENNGLRKDFKEKDQIIAQKSDEIRSANRNLRSDSDRIIEDLKRNKGEAKNDAVQARAALGSVNEKLVEQRAEIKAERESANAELQSVKRELLSAKEVTREQDRLISQKDARIEALEMTLEDHNEMMPWSSTQDDATLPGPAVEVSAEIRGHIEALSAIAAWEEGFRFVEDGEFNDARAMADVGAILSEAQPRRRLREFLMEGPLDTWACLSRVGEHGFFAESVTLTDDLRRLVHSGGVSCRLVMVTTVDSVYQSAGLSPCLRRNSNSVDSPRSLEED